MKSVVFISDLHAGHRLGLCSPVVDLSNGGHYRANEVQRELFSFYCELIDEWGNPDILVVVGDAIDGQGWRNHGVEMWSTNVLEQVNEASKLIDLWAADETYLLEGTDYHVSFDGTPAEELIALNLNCAPWPGRPNRHCGQELYLTVDDVTMHISHHIGVSNMFHYRGTPISREMLFSIINGAFRHDLNHYKTTLVVRAHAHYFVNVRFTTQAGLILPAWQAKTSYMVKKSPLGMVPDIGAVRLQIEGSEYTQQERFRNIELIQRPPHVIK